MNPEAAFQPIVKLSENLRIARKRRGLRIVDLAQAAGCSQDTLRRLERGDPRGISRGARSRSGDGPPLSCIILHNIYYAKYTSSNPLPGTRRTASMPSDASQPLSSGLLDYWVVAARPGSRCIRYAVVALSREAAASR
jgi:Helix-turn-helix domain